MNGLGKILVGLALTLLASTSESNDLLEFSTSMDFEEFAVVIAYLKKSEAALANEIERELANFKATESAGGTRRHDLAKSQGYVLLEREDDYAFTIAVFTDAQLHAKLEAAYLSATAELGI